ncbi:MAG: hypothetical protein ACI8X3_003306, partial [Saprospiraceae bacterium]
MEKGFITAILFIFSTYTLIAQGSAIPLGTDSYHISDRLEIMSGIEAPYHSSTKPYLRGDLTRYAIQIDSTATTLTALDRKDLYYIFNDNNEWLGQSEFSTALTGAKEPTYTKVYVDSTNTFYHLKSNQPAASKRSNHYVTRDKPILKHFYKTPANFFELDQDYFHLKLNPIINFKLARAKNDDELVFQNTRGVEIRGSIDDR